MPPFLLFAALGAGGLRNPWAWSLFAVASWGAASTAIVRARLPGGGFWAAALAWAGVSALVSPEPARSVAAFAYGATAWLWLDMGAVRSDDEARRLGLGLLWASAAVAACAAAVVDIESYRAVGLFYPYYNYTAALVAAAGAAAVAVPGPAAAFGPAAAAAYLCWAGSRGGMAALGAGAAVALWRAGRRARLAAAAVLAAAFFAVPSGPRDSFLKKARPGSHLRPAIWRSALTVAGESPWLGEGPGRFDRGSLRHQAPAPPGMAPVRFPFRADRAHSEALGAAAEVGLVGALLLLAAFWALLRALPRGPAGVPREGLLAASAALGTQAAGDSIFALPALAWVFAWSLGAACAPEPGAPRALGSPRRLALAGGLVLAAGAWWPGWAVSTWRRADPQAALRLAVSDDGLWQDLARTRLGRGDARGALEALGRAAELAPYSAPVRVMAGEVLRGVGAWRELKSVAEETLALEPSCGQATLQKAEAELRLGLVEESRRTLGTLEASGAKALDSLGGHRDRLIFGYDAGRAASLRAELKPNP